MKYVYIYSCARRALRAHFNFIKTKVIIFFSFGFSLDLFYFPFLFLNRTTNIKHEYTHKKVR